MSNKFAGRGNHTNHKNQVTCDNPNIDDINDAYFDIHFDEESDINLLSDYQKHLIKIKFNQFYEDLKGATYYRSRDEKQKSTWQNEPQFENFITTGIDLFMILETFKTICFTRFSRIINFRFISCIARR